MTSHDPDFWERAGDVCGLYLNSPENAVVRSVDEKSGIRPSAEAEAPRTRRQFFLDQATLGRYGCRRDYLLAWASEQRLSRSPTR